MNYITLILCVSLGWYFAVISEQYSKATFLIALCILFTQWVCPPKSDKKD